MSKKFTLDFGFTGMKVKDFVFYYDLEINRELCSVQVYVEIVNKDIRIKGIECVDYRLSNEDMETIIKDFNEKVDNDEINFPETVFFDCSNKNLVDERNCLKDFTGGDWYPHELKHYQTT
jgi:hypothetical protein